MAKSSLKFVSAFKVWTGGSAPKPLSEISKAERATVKASFREQCETYREFWNDLPIHIVRIFWNRARHDAHAQHRHA